jgi:hypothetical protein
MKIIVWSLVMWHRQGDSVQVFPTEAAAKAAINAYVVENWPCRMGDATMPSDFEEAATTYFEAQEDESAFMEPHEIEIGVPAQS